MYVKIDGYDLKKMFENYDRNYYSLEACKTIVEVEDDIYSNDIGIEVDIISLCSIWSEYSKNELIYTYSYLLSKENFENEEEYFENLIKKIENKYLVFALDNDNFLVMEG